MATKSANVVRQGLLRYADRGVLRRLDESKTHKGKQSFKFLWVGNRPLEFETDTETAVLTFKRLLPNVPPTSGLYADLKRFLESRSGSELPKHRRIDPKRAEVLWVNRRASVSIALKVKNNQYAYALNRLVNLVHEIFVQLNDSHPDYMCENFDAPQE